MKYFIVFILYSNIVLGFPIKDSIIMNKNIEFLDTEFFDYSGEENLSGESGIEENYDEDANKENNNDSALAFIIVMTIIICIPCVIKILFVSCTCLCTTLKTCFEKLFDYFKQLKISYLYGIKNVLKNKLEKVTQKSDKFGDECSICMTDNKNLISLNCKHVYHKKCITTWIKKELKEDHIPVCPICRNNIFDDIELSKIKGTYKREIIISNYSYSYSSESDSNDYDEY